MTNLEHIYVIRNQDSNEIINLEKETNDAK